MSCLTLQSQIEASDPMIAGVSPSSDHHSSQQKKSTHKDEWIQDPYKAKG